MSTNIAMKPAADDLTDLSATKQRLLELRLKKRAAEGVPSSIPRRNGSVAPLSFAQQRLWFLEQLQPGTSTYVVANAIPLLAPVDVAVLEQALNEMLRRHESLRTVFRIVDGAPAQMVTKAGLMQLPFVDLRGLSDAERKAHTNRLVNEIRRPFDLERGPLMRATLLRPVEEQYVLYLGLHHIVADGWSLGIIARELTALYGAFSEGKPSPLRELGIQYGDFAEWQREWLTSDVMSGHLEYWKKQLAGLTTLNLRTTQKPRLQTFKSGIEMKKLSGDVSSKIKALAQGEKATLFMAMLAAFQVLLARHTGQLDVTVGSPVAGRTRVETEPLVGCFVNMLVLRADLSGSPGFREVLRRVKELALQAYEHEQAPFETLVEELKPERDLTRSPLFQVMFALESAKSVQAAARDVFYALPGESAAKYDLTLLVAELEHNLQCCVEFDSGVFDVAIVRRLLGHFEVLLEAIVANPDTPISELPILSSRELRQLTVDWNDTQTRSSEERCIHQLFESQVKRTGNNVAVSFGRERLTYRELDRRANSLASSLRKRGVGPGQLVGICLERSTEMMVALLGVLKAGAAYVPLDPHYPLERLRFMQQDSGMKMALTQRNLGGLIAEGVDTFVVGSEENARANVEDELPPGEDALAYVIYTSGSTGQPKGVEVRHRSVVNLLESMKWQPGLTQQDHLLAVTTLSFDIAALELFLPLTVGAEVVIASREMAADPTALTKRMKQSGITVMQATPATWQMLVEAGWKGDPRLRILCGGEALTRELANELLSRSAQVWNMYGPTETTIWSSAIQVRRGADPIVLGRGIANTQFYVADQNFQLVPIGVTGELFIGGAGVAEGYWNRPELTAEKFIPNPFQPGDTWQKLFRTGDLVRYREDGTIEYLGRADQQVKIRGYRIELGEIESVLREQPEVSDAVVIEGENPAGERQLIAYVTGVNGKAPNKQELRQQLKVKLPDYMMPAILMTLDAMPVGPSGKIDRKALPKPEFETTSQPELLGAEDELEIQLTRIWERLLGRSPIGIREDFFDLGGHSLMAVRLFSEMEKILGRTVPLATLFTASTIEQLAKILRQQGWEPPWSSLVTLQPRGSRAPFFCIHSLGTILVSYRKLAQRVGNDQPFYGLQPLGLDGRQQPHSRVEDMAAHYIEEIRKVQPKGPYSIGGVCLGGVVAFEMAQQLLALGEQVSRLVLIDSHFPAYSQHHQSGALRQRVMAIADSYLGELLALPGREKLRYLSRRVRSAANRGRNHVHAIAGKLRDGNRDETVFAATLRKVKEANALAEYSYTPKYYPGHVIQLWCSGMPTRSYGDRRLAWSEVAGSGLEVHVVPGTHMTMLEEPHLQVLAEKLRDCLLNSRQALQAAS